MRKRLPLLLGALLITVAGPAEPGAETPRFTVIDLSELIAGATDSAAFDISPAGLIAGTVRVNVGETRAAVWTASTGLSLDSPYGGEWAQGISDDGTMVGSFIGTGTGWFFRGGFFDCIPLPDPCGSFNNLWRTSSGRAINRFNTFTGAISPFADEPPSDPIQAYLGSFDDGGDVVIQRLGTFQGEATQATDLNDYDVAVGISGGSLQWTALLFRDGTVEALPDLGGEYNWAEGINNVGFAIGIASEPGASQWPYPADGLLWDTDSSPITYEVLGRLPGAQQTRPFDLNDLNQVVGTSIDPDLMNQRAFLWVAGALYDLNELTPADSGWHLEVANAINDAGHIVGYGRRDGLPGRRAYLLKPAVIMTADFENGHLGEWSTFTP